MKLPIDWLKEYVEIEASDKEIAEKLTMIGHEVEEIEKQSGFEGVVVGQVFELAKHPNADKLHLVKVNIGGEKPLQIVCGANNLKVGIKVPVVLVGGQIGKTKITKANLRGVTSEGMICSERELDLGDDHQGIKVLDDKAVVGAKFSDSPCCGSVVDLKIQPNRSDCMGIIGLARELAAAYDAELREPGIRLSEAEGKLAGVEVIVEDADFCPRYMAKVIKGVEVAPSPKWLQERLISVGIRPINNIVDATNFVMYEYGQPLHAFDLAKISRTGKCQIHVRKAKKQEKIVTLDGETRILDDGICVIADETGPIAIGGIMGGKNSEVSNGTVDVLLEAAVFDKTMIRRGAKTLGIRSEAVSRFEKGLSLELPQLALNRAVKIIAEISGGTTASGVADVKSKWSWISHIGLDTKKLKNILQIKISNQEIISILERLGLEVEEFDIVTEARKHFGKPYLYGANYKQNGTSSFDCSYLLDYIYSLIGIFIGHDTLAQIHHGREVKLKELRAGDALFIELPDTKPKDGFYIKDDDNNHQKINTKKHNKVTHVGMYLGSGQVIHASKYDYTKRNLPEKPINDQRVEIVSLETFSKNPGFIGARRYLEDISNYLAVTVPWWRQDLSSQADLFEEIARIYGYDRIPAKLPKSTGFLPEKNMTRLLAKRTKNLLANIGLSEIMTYPFVTLRELEEVGHTVDEELKVANPLVKGQDYMRGSLLPKMLVSLSDNQFKEEKLKFFEIGRTFTKSGHENSPAEEKNTLSIGIIGQDSWPFQYQKNQSFYQLKGIISRLVGEIGVFDTVSYRELKTNKLFGQAASEILINRETLGVLGEISSPAGEFFGLKRQAAVAEIDLAVLEPYLLANKKFIPFSKFQKVNRDISFFCSTNFPIQKLVDSLRDISKEIHEISVIDIYGTESLGARSITIRIKIWPQTKTMTDHEVEEIVTKCNNKIEKQGGKIRSDQK